ncbi:hypothetical protein MAIT1_01057 [Magnetofaba australis IT-1]|uniref:Uncharacterized protein n=1 Tax=Magnetofaba australis IT-1 TaxID=1434232 RepID=A0A1Y2K7W9_9PROT|nr:hypothetical protein MAIT1_01057 [Magnetofaba australis IT-1]
MQIRHLRARLLNRTQPGGNLLVVSAQQRPLQPGQGPQCVDAPTIPSAFNHFVAGHIAFKLLIGGDPHLPVLGAALIAGHHFKEEGLLIAGRRIDRQAHAIAQIQRLWVGALLNVGKVHTVDIELVHIRCKRGASIVGGAISHLHRAGNRRRAHSGVIRGGKLRGIGQRHAVAAAIGPTVHRRGGQICRIERQIRTRTAKQRHPIELRVGVFQHVVIQRPRFARGGGEHIRIARGDGVAQLQDQVLRIQIFVVHIAQRGFGVLEALGRQRGGARHALHLRQIVGQQQIAERRHRIIRRFIGVLRSERLLLDRRHIAILVLQGRDTGPIE